MLAAVGVLIVCELAFGALDFGETRIADACTTQANFEGGGIDGASRVRALGDQRRGVRAGDSREELVLSLVPSAGGVKVRWDKATINRALRTGIERASKDTAGNPLLGGVSGVLERCSPTSRVAARPGRE